MSRCNDVSCGCTFYSGRNIVEPYKHKVMEKAKISDKELRLASEKGLDSFVETVVRHTYDLIGGELTASTMQMLSSAQITLLAYNILRDEVMDGGYVQLIHNGYGGFLFMNPFARAMKEWGMDDLARHVRKVIPLYKKYRNKIERECSDEEFMAMFEQMPEFDDYDDAFVANEEQWTSQIAFYIDEHLDKFVEVVS